MLEHGDSLLASLLLMDSLPTWSVASSDLSLSVLEPLVLDVDADPVSENISLWEGVLVLKQLLYCIFAMLL